ncbi:hypothetical protein CBOM_04797 [Ceraceosorus bombacis]|uniref:Uncharacterized protein n=1 Tax=Ceraceosorus bombacis TaxID=401625 RepID=A0A0P1BND5_9BASI|nr:hypothetical protein CBOM_04797 [Ceraceosorus bombacis]
MPLFASLRNKKGRRGSLSSTGTAPAAGSDFGPTSPSRGSVTSAKQTNGTGRAGNGHLTKRSSVSQLNGNGAVVPSGLPTIPASSTAPAVGSPTSETAKDPTAAPAPKPSELFAGKGVQWDSVRLAGPQARLATATSNSQAGTSEDLQSFLKA